jgi:hypothetical protein
MNGVVLSNGDYVVCTHDAQGELVLGNVVTQGYLALRSSAFERVRLDVAAKRLRICSTCSMSANLGYVEHVPSGRVLPGSVNFSEAGLGEQFA